MSYSVRTFLLDRDDTLYRLAGTKYSAMLDEPEKHRLLMFAGQRVRMAEAIVDFYDRIPREVVRLVYELIPFDAHGTLDRVTRNRQLAAAMNLVVGEVIGPPRTDERTVVEASSRFIAQGIRWRPSASLARQIHQAALGQFKCKRIDMSSQY
jgi:hypothetical protein